MHKDINSSPRYIWLADPFPVSFQNKLMELGWNLLEKNDPRAPELSTVLLINSAFSITAESIKKWPCLKLILRAGVGTDHMDLEAISQAGIQLYNTPGANAQAVGEMATGALLSLVRNIYKSNLEVKNKIWKREINRGFELSELKIGIIGLGNTGSAFANCLKGFNTRILAYDKYKSDWNPELAEKVELEELLSTAEVISLHIPQTAETFNLINEDFFNQWKPAKFLLNFSRGGIVNLPSLISALDRGSLLGVHLDVLPQEKFNPNTNELLLPESEQILYQQVLNHPKIQMSPHIGGWTYRSKTEIENALLNSLQTWMQEKGYTPQ